VGGGSNVEQAATEEESRMRMKILVDKMAEKAKKRRRSATTGRSAQIWKKAFVWGHRWSTTKRSTSKKLV
jgi:hypothetical protein